MIVLHGKGDSLRPFKKFNQELDLDGINFLLLNAPKKYLDGYSWYGEPPFLRKGVGKIRNKITTLLKDLEILGWKSEDIFLLGYSQGCLIGADVALHWPKRLGGVVGVSGYMEFFPHWRKKINRNKLQMPWMFTHGRRDEVLPIEKTRKDAGKLRSMGFDVKWVESEKAHSFAESDYPAIKKWVAEKLR